MMRLSDGGLIDRAQPLRFTFDGKRYAGFAGDTLASALLGAGVRLMARSFKYHRPRGVLTAGSEEPNALVTLRAGARAEPNTRATTIELYDQLEASSQNRWPSLRFDAMAINQLAAPLFVAGFYYKTFMWPAMFWERIYEPLIRRAAGLGKLSGAPDPDTYDRAHAFCDLLIIGAGPAGLSAALTAARAGLDVIVADDDWRLGGRLLSERKTVNGQAGADWAAQAARELASFSNVRVLTRASVFGAYDDGVFGAVERMTDHLPSPPAGAPRQRYWKIAAAHAFLAAGAIERPLVFSGNDRPGVMTAGAVSTYLNRFAVSPGRRAAVFTSTDSGWASAVDLQGAGIEVAAVVDTRPHASPFAPRLDGCAVLHGASVTQTRGATGVYAVNLRDASGATFEIAADVLAVSGGWSPNLGLACHRGARPAWSETAQAYLLDSPPAGMQIIGAANARFSLADALEDGHRAAQTLARALGKTPPDGRAPHAEAEGTAVAPAPMVKGKGKAFVDFQHDVTSEDVALAAREGFVSVEHMKRYTTLGMGTDQGKTSQTIGNALLAQYTGRSIGETGTILPRPPQIPVALGVLAGHHRGEHFRPTRRTASHAWAQEQGAVFVDAGQWKRAQWYPRPGETDWLESVSREVRAVRSGVGVCDVSTLGKIEVCGPDAGALLDRLYINTFSTLPIGRARYGVMLREDGFVMDDGTTARLTADRYFLTTTTVNAAKVMQHIDFARQALWPDLDVQAVSVTEQWAQYAVAGPQSRALLQNLLGDTLDISNTAFPFMAARAFRWRGIATRLYRISFSGELAYEIGVPAHYGEALVRALMDAGRDLDVTPYGTEALGVMRIEKGHAAGNELNGQTTAADLGLGRMMAKKKDFIGRTMAARPGLTDPDRLALVGVRPVDKAARLRGGAHLLPIGAPAQAAHDEGHVTSVAYSPTLQTWIGLALIRRGPQRWGERVRAYDPVRGGDVAVEVCNPVFIDPEGTRLHG